MWQIIVFLGSFMMKVLQFSSICFPVNVQRSLPGISILTISLRLIRMTANVMFPENCDAVSRSSSANIFFPLQIFDMQEICIE